MLCAGRLAQRMAYVHVQRGYNAIGGDDGSACPYSLRRPAKAMYLRQLGSGQDPSYVNICDLEAAIASVNSLKYSIAL